MDDIVKLILANLLTKMETMTQDERSEVFEELNDSYCKYCYNEHPERGGSCQCTNDE